MRNIDTTVEKSGKYDRERRINWVCSLWERKEQEHRADIEVGWKDERREGVRLEVYGLSKKKRPE